MIKHFLEKYLIDKELATNENRNKIAVYSSVMGIVINIFLAISKIIVGFFSKSVSIMADGINNSFDIMTSLFSLVGYKITRRPADKYHPRGYGRVEYITSLAVSIIIIFIGIEFIKSSYERIVNPVELKFMWAYVAVVLFSVPVKFFLYLYYKKVSEIINSTTFRAIAIDAISDVFTSILVIIPIFVSRYTDYPVDGIVGLMISIYIIYSGYSIIKETLSFILGKDPDRETIDKILNDLYSCEYINNIHDLKFHNYGVGREIVTMDIEIPVDIDFITVHNNIELVRKAVEETYNIELVIHMDPIKHDEKETEYINKIKDQLKIYKEVTGIYDVQILGKEIFLDIELIDANSENTERIKKDILDKLQSINPDFTWQIKFIYIYL